MSLEKTQKEKIKKQVLPFYGAINPFLCRWRKKTEFLFQVFLYRMLKTVRKLMKVHYFPKPVTNHNLFVFPCAFFFLQEKRVLRNKSWEQLLASLFIFAQKWNFLYSGNNFCKQKKNANFWGLFLFFVRPILSIVFSGFTTRTFFFCQKTGFVFWFTGMLFFLSKRRRNPNQRHWLSHSAKERRFRRSNYG